MNNTIGHILNLDPNFILDYGPQIPHIIFKFPAQESHIKLSPVTDFVTDVLITHRLNNAENIMELLLATDAIRRRFKGVRVSAYFPYIPYARQDKLMVTGEPFSLKVFTNLINSQNYEKISVLEPHSDVAGALINNLEEIFPYYLITADKIIKKNFGEFVLIAPDGGALKRIYKQATTINYKGNIYCANKMRDVSTGKIIRTEINDNGELKDKVAVIFDDVGSYMNTFMNLSKVLKEKCGAKNVILVVAHHEGVADNAKLQESGIDMVITTNSRTDINDGWTKVINL